MANTPSLNDSNLCFGIASPIADNRVSFVSRIRADTSCSQTSRARCPPREASSKKAIAAVSRGGLSSNRRKKGASTCDGLVGAVTGRLRCDFRAGSPLRIVERPCTPMMP